MATRLSAAALRLHNKAKSEGAVSSVRWRGKAASRATQSVAPSTRSKAKSKRSVGERRARSERPGRSGGGIVPAHQQLPRSLGAWCSYGNLPVQAATQTVLVNVRSQFNVIVGSADVNMFFYPGANDTIGWYTNGIGGLALADNTTTGIGYSKLSIPMLTSLVSGSPKTVPEWRPTRLWVRVHNTTIFTSRVGGCIVTRPKGSWSTFSPGSVGAGQVVSQANLAALPESRFHDFSQMAGPVDFVIGTFPTDLEAYSFMNTTAPDSTGVSTNWISDATDSGQKWAPLNFYMPGNSTNQTVTFEVFASYDCKISEALSSTSPMATLAAPPPVGAPHDSIKIASSALNAGSNNMRNIIVSSVAGAGIGLGMMNVARNVNNLARLAPLMVPLLA